MRHPRLETISGGKSEESGFDLFPHVRVWITPNGLSEVDLAVLSRETSGTAEAKCKDPGSVSLDFQTAQCRRVTSRASLQGAEGQDTPHDDDQMDWYEFPDGRS